MWQGENIIYPSMGALAISQSKDEAKQKLREWQKTNKETGSREFEKV